MFNGQGVQKVHTHGDYIGPTFIHLGIVPIGRIETWLDELRQRGVLFDEFLPLSQKSLEDGDNE